MAAAEIVVAVLAAAAGLGRMIETGDWTWLAWVFIVLSVSLRCLLCMHMQARAEDAAETWRRMYDQQADVALELFWENEKLRKERDVEQ